MRQTIIRNQEADNSQTIRYLIYFFSGVIESLLVARLIFKVMGANPNSSFVRFINATTGLLIAPFNGIFRQATTPGIETTAVLEPAVLIAMVTYAFLAWGIAELVVILSGKMK
jgi:hypothetical protein